ncbi:MAG: hypothetical protein IE909_03470 [Campylobacterales bacterium]|nr:hypothetical protein [Campylobacterales bacterium]
MKIEFRKVPLQESKFDIGLQLASFSGTFCKISPRLVKLEGKLSGELEVDCYKCGKTFLTSIDEVVELLISDGEHRSSEDDNLIVVEVDDSIIDFSMILESEIESLKSEYYICSQCEAKNDDEIDLEY